MNLREHTHLHLTILLLGVVGFTAFLLVPQSHEDFPTLPGSILGGSDPNTPTRVYTSEEGMQGVIFQPDVHNFITCATDSDFPFFAENQADIGLNRFWVYEYTGNEPPFDGRFYVSQGEYQASDPDKQKLYNELLTLRGAITSFEPETQYYLMNETTIGFKCTIGLGWEPVDESEESNESEETEDESEEESESITGEVEEAEEAEVTLPDRQAGDGTKEDEIETDTTDEVEETEVTDETKDVIETEEEEEAEETEGSQPESPISDSTESEEVSDSEPNSDSNSEPVAVEPIDRVKIFDCEDLQHMNDDVSGHYILEQDIDCSDTSGWNNGAGFEPIGYVDGNPKNVFTGSFDGNGFSIINLTIQRPTQSFVGLFSQTEDARIVNIDLINPVISGNIHVGALVGSFFSEKAQDKIARVSVRSPEKRGKIEGSFRTGGIAGTLWGHLEDSFAQADIVSDRWAGGAIGTLFSGRIERVYTTGTVVSASEAGGIVGSMEREQEWLDLPFIGYTIAANSVRADEKVGAMVGSLIDGELVHTYWIQNGSTDNCIGDGNGDCTRLEDSDSYFQDLDALPLAQWDFDTIWQGTHTYPVFQWQVVPEEASYTLIHNCTELQGIQDNLEIVYRLANDIDCSDSSTWNSDEGFEPIGSAGSPFKGEFDGRGFVIENVSIDRSSNDTSDTGLFGFVDSATIERVMLRNVSIKGNEYVGSLAGRLRKSSVSHITIDGGMVSGRDTVGGAVGENDSTIHDAHVRLSSVVGESVVGGLVGANYDLISNGFAETEAVGTEVIGGLIGRNTGIVEVSYSRGSTNAPEADKIGGLVGENSGDLYNTFSENTVYGKKDVGGLVGFNEGSVIDSYTNGYTEGSDENIGGLIGYMKDGSVENAFTVNSVIGPDNSFIGTLIGRFNGNAEIENSYWNNHNTNPDHCLTLEDQTVESSYCKSVISRAKAPHFFESSNEPLSAWDFDVWIEHSEQSFPTFTNDLIAECSAAADCNDKVGCTVDICSNSGMCVYDYSDCECSTSADCDDSIACTKDVCNEKFTCINTEIDCMESECGDGVLSPSEQCDIGDSSSALDKYGCIECQIQPGFNCSGTTSVCELLTPKLP